MTRNRARKAHNRKTAKQQGISYTKASRTPKLIGFTENGREPVFYDFSKATGPFWNGRAPGEAGSLLILDEIAGPDSSANLLAKMLSDSGEIVHLASGPDDGIDEVITLLGEMRNLTDRRLRVVDPSTNQPVYLVVASEQAVLAEENGIAAQMVDDLVRRGRAVGVHLVFSGSLSTLRRLRAHAGMDVLWARSSDPSEVLLPVLSRSGTLPMRRRDQGILFPAGEAEPKAVWISPKIDIGKTGIGKTARQPRWRPTNGDHLLVIGRERVSALRSVASRLANSGAEVFCISQSEPSDLPAKLARLAATDDEAARMLADLLDRTRRREVSTESPIYLAIEDADKRLCVAGLRDSIREIAGATGLGVHLLVAGNSDIELPRDHFETLFHGAVLRADWDNVAHSSNFARPTLGAEDYAVVSSTGRGIRISRTSRIHPVLAPGAEQFSWSASDSPTGNLAIVGNFGEERQAALSEIARSLSASGAEVVFAASSKHRKYGNVDRPSLLSLLDVRRAAERVADRLSARESGEDGSRSPIYLLLEDDSATLTFDGGATDAAVRQLIGKLAHVGRAYGVHVVLSSPKPQLNPIPGIDTLIPGRSLSGLWSSTGRPENTPSIPFRDYLLAPGRPGPLRHLASLTSSELRWTGDARDGEAQHLVVIASSADVRNEMLHRLAFSLKAVGRVISVSDDATPLPKESPKSTTFVLFAKRPSSRQRLWLLDAGPNVHAVLSVEAPEDESELLEGRRADALHVDASHPPTNSPAELLGQQERTRFNLLPGEVVLYPANLERQPEIVRVEQVPFEWGELDGGAKHLAVAGRTCSGKTVAMHHLARVLAERGNDVLFVDPKLGVSTGIIDGVRTTITSVDEAITAALRIRGCVLAIDEPELLEDSSAFAKLMDAVRDGDERAPRLVLGVTRPDRLKGELEGLFDVLHTGAIRPVQPSLGDFIGGGRELVQRRRLAKHSAVLYPADLSRQPQLAFIPSPDWSIWPATNNS